MSWYKNFGRSLRSRLSSVGSGRQWFFFEENRNRNSGVVIVSVLMGWMRELRVGAGAKGWWGYDFDGVEGGASRHKGGSGLGRQRMFLAWAVFSGRDLAAPAAWRAPHLSKCVFKK
jgi:hypothetical protein